MVIDALNVLHTVTYQRAQFSVLHRFCVVNRPKMFVTYHRCRVQIPTSVFSFSTRLCCTFLTRSARFSCCLKADTRLSCIFKALEPLSICCLHLSSMFLSCITNCLRFNNISLKSRTFRRSSAA